MAKATNKKKSDEETVISEYSGNEITQGDLQDPDVHDGQAWREGRAVGDPPKGKKSKDQE